MLIEKNILKSLDTIDPNLPLARDPQAAKLEWLRAKFKGRCMSRMYVMDVLRINRDSPWLSQWQRAGGSWCTDIDFTVQALVYDRDEIITNARILHILDTGTFILQSEHTDIDVAQHPDLQHYKVKEYMPVRVVASRYTAYKKRISCSAVPLSPVPGPHMQKVHVRITHDEQKSLEPKYEQIRQLQKQVDQLQPELKKRYQEFKKILYPYKTTPELKGVVSISEISEAVVWRPDWCDMDQAVCISEPATGQPVENSINVLREFLQTVIKNINVLLQFTELYQIDQSTQHIWATYMRRRLDVPGRIPRKAESPRLKPEARSPVAKPRSPSPGKSRSPSPSKPKSPGKKK